jgi:hypothetical protein
VQTLPVPFPRELQSLGAWPRDGSSPSSDTGQPSLILQEKGDS